MQEVEIVDTALDMGSRCLTIREEQRNESRHECTQLPSANSQFLLELLANEVDRVRRHFVHFVACQQQGHPLLAALEVTQHREQKPEEGTGMCARARTK